MQVRALTRRYGLTFDGYLRASLHFTELLMPTLPVVQAINGSPNQGKTPPPEAITQLPLAGSGAASAQPADGTSTSPPPALDFLQNFLHAALPEYKLIADFHRVSAIIDDAVMNLRAKRMEVSAMLTASGLRLSAKRKVGYLADPTTVQWERDQFISHSTLDFLSRIGKQTTYVNFFPVGRECVDFNSPSSSEEAQRGLSLTRVDLVRWLPVLQYYGWVRGDLTIGDRLSANDAALIVAGFSHLMGDITEGVCFLFEIIRRLPCEDFRQDLLIIHERAKLVHAAADRELLHTEAAILQFSGYLDVMTEKLLIFASKARALHPIYGPEDAVPAVAEARIANGPNRQALTKVDIHAFEVQETEVL